LRGRFAGFVPFDGGKDYREQPIRGDRKGGNVCVKKKRRLICRPDSVPAGRRFVAEALAEWGVPYGGPEPGAGYDALLVTSELLTNAVRASAGRVTLEITGHRDHLEIGVTDDNPGRASLATLDPRAESGRGLQIIDSLCREWGQSEHDGHAKRVWCNLSLAQTPASLAASCNS
jgi:anti-sigma regulatory factor (Ser/Thr protein kinase)